jgi:hypothetical protein
LRINAFSCRQRPPSELILTTERPHGWVWRRLFCALFTTGTHRIFLYQDRLGTSIGNVEKETVNAGEGLQGQPHDTRRGLGRCEKRAVVAPFQYSNDHFAKTGSGQTRRNAEKTGAFPAPGLMEYSPGSWLATTPQQMEFLASKGKKPVLCAPFLHST